MLTRDPARARHLAGPGVEVIRGDVRDPVQVARAVHGAGTVVSAVHGFTGPGGVCPASVDRAGNASLIGAAARAGATFVLVSVVGAAPSHPIGLFRAKHAAEETLRASGIPWAIVRATAFMETWATIMGRPLLASGKILVFGRGDNPVNFVSAADVAALIELTVTDPGLRGQVVELGGPDNFTFNQLAAILQQSTGRHATVRHIPRPALQVMAFLTGASQARAGPPGPGRARHGHPRHDLRPRPGPAGIPGPAEHRHAVSSQTAAGLTARAPAAPRTAAKAGHQTSCTPPARAMGPPTRHRSPPASRPACPSRAAHPIRSPATGHLQHPYRAGTRAHPAPGFRAVPAKPGPGTAIDPGT